MSDIGELSSKLQTLVWIGDPHAAEFQEAYDHCVAHAAQVALRPNLDEALRRPASHVGYIVQTNDSREPLDFDQQQQLASLYPQASMIRLLGTLCEGMRIEEEPIQGANRVYWHRWQQVLPGWLESESEPQAKVGTVVVLAASYTLAEPLLELAESAGATAIWCRQVETLKLRNVDTVWWDDSVASPTSSRGWRQRLEAVRTRDAGSRHAWIANAPRLNQHRDAIRGGVDVILSKPHRIEALTATLAVHSAAQGMTGETTPGLKAA